MAIFSLLLERVALSPFPRDALGVILFRLLERRRVAILFLHLEKQDVAIGSLLLERQKVASFSLLLERLERQAVAISFVINHFSTLFSVLLGRPSPSIKKKQGAALPFPPSSSRQATDCHPLPPSRGT